ncbi:MAG TPA: hypothetical protein VFZ65_01335 [Planctomycetota bacterium]|nr:hypothetical protein [Planctomycetota bacterium]
MPPTLPPPRSRSSPPVFDRDPGDRFQEPARPEPTPHEPSRWLWLAAGLVAAYVAGFVLPGQFTWFLSAIPHEMGHATVGCLLGHPSAPAISLRGEAWTGIAELRPWLVWTMAIGFAAGAWHLRGRLAACIALGVVSVLIPLLAFARAADVLIIAGGHLGELAFATYCFWLAWTGGHTDTPQERTASAMAGGLVQLTNLKLCFGLMTSAAMRDLYAHNGSVGLKNDYLVLAEDLLHCRLPSVAIVMFVLAMLPLPLGLAIGWWRDRAVDAG